MSKIYSEVIAAEVARRVFGEVFAFPVAGYVAPAAGVIGAAPFAVINRTDAEIQDCAERAIKITQKAFAAL